MFINKRFRKGVVNASFYRKKYFDLEIKVSYYCDDSLIRNFDISLIGRNSRLLNKVFR